MDIGKMIEDQRHIVINLLKGETRALAILPCFWTRNSARVQPLQRNHPT